MNTEKLYLSNQTIKRTPSQETSVVKTEKVKIWTINFDLNTQDSGFKKKIYDEIHKFLSGYDFQYRQHSGDISTREMTQAEVIDTLDSLYDEMHKKNLPLEKWTKSCLFTSVDGSYSFTDLRKEQLKSRGKVSNFSMSLTVNKNDSVIISLN